MATRYIGLIVFLAAFLVLATLAGCSGCRIVGAGETGVVRLFGKVEAKELHSGIHWINPLKRVKRLSIRTEEYTMSGIEYEGEKVGDDSISVLTSEGLKVELDITLLYRLIEEQASTVYRELGERYVDKIIRPVIRGNIRAIVARFTAKDIYSARRSEVEEQIYQSLVTIAQSRGVLVEKALLRNVKLPPKLASAIEDKLEADQQAQKMEFVLQRERLEAERRRVEAEGIRDAQEIIAAKLTPSYLRWYSIEMMKALAESTNTTFLFVPTDKQGMPIINITER